MGVSSASNCQFNNAGPPGGSELMTHSSWRSHGFVSTNSMFYHRLVAVNHSGLTWFDYGKYYGHPSLINWLIILDLKCLCNQPLINHHWPSVNQTWLSTRKWVLRPVLVWDWHSVNLEPLHLDWAAEGLHTNYDLETPGCNPLHLQPNPSWTAQTKGTNSLFRNY